MLASLLPYLLAFAFLAIAMHVGTSPPAAAAPKQAQPIKPTVGRIVNYVIPHGRSKGRIAPAMIVRVFTDSMVNLVVFLDGFNDAEALRQAATPAAAQRELKLVDWATSTQAQHVEPGVAGDLIPGSWHWMPYQVGQAAKTEQVGGQAAAQVKALTDVVADLSRRLAALEGPAALVGPRGAEVDKTPLMQAALPPTDENVHGRDVEVDLSKVADLAAPAADAPIATGTADSPAG